MKHAITLSWMLLIATATAGAAQPTYAQIKAAFRATLLARQGATASWPASQEYDVASAECEDGPSFMTEHDLSATGARTLGYDDIAARIAQWEVDLPRAGYPARVWSAWTGEYEAKALANATAVASNGDGRFFWNRSADLNGLKAVLVSYRRTHPQAEPVTNFGGCGAGEMDVRVVTRPAATQLAIIPSFFYELCRVRHIDPNDTSRCAHWREITGAVAQISGNYHYVATWHDGTVKRGVLYVEFLDDGSTITLRKP